MEFALKAERVSRGYGKGAARCEALKDFSLALAPGEFVALMGPSGSGKSTFLNLAAGLLLPDAGTVEIGGAAISSMGDGAATRFRRRHLGVVFQSFNLIETLTVEENVLLPARLDHVRPDRARAADLLARLGLSDCAKRRPAELSGGEQQRTAFARALLMRPDVVLADEPTGNLDARAAHAICDLLREVNATERSAILVVTHDPVVAATATRVCILKDGALAADRPTEHDAEKVSRLYLETCR